MPPENLLNPNRRNLDGSTQVFQESSRYNRLVSLGCLLACRLGREVTLTIPQTNLFFNPVREGARMSPFPRASAPCWSWVFVKATR